MKRLGSLLMLLGAAVGVTVGIAMIMGVRVNGVPLLVAIGLAKLTLVSSLGLMAGGAVLRRMGVRREAREELREPV
jgi:hypothetical protein